MSLDCFNQNHRPSVQMLTVANAFLSKFPLLPDWVLVRPSSDDPHSLSSVCVISMHGTLEVKTRKIRTFDCIFRYLLGIILHIKYT
jgi:hypothetical protein